MKHWTEFLRTSNGSVEINRLVGFLGGIAYIIGAHVFLTYEVMWLGKAFDLGTYCLTFPTGLAAVVGGTAAAVSIKDRNVAVAKQINETGVVPSKDNAGTDANPVKAEIVNTPDAPVVVQETHGDERPSYAV